MDNDDINLALTWAAVTVITWILILLIFPKNWIGMIIAFVITILYTHTAINAYVDRN